MHTVLEMEVDSPIIPFLPISSTIQISPREHHEIQDIISQMEPWSTFSSSLLLRQADNFVQTGFPIGVQNSSSAAWVFSGSENKDSIRFCAKNMIRAQVNQPVLSQSVLGAEPWETNWAEGNEFVEWIRGFKKLSPNRLTEFVDASVVKDDGLLPPVQTFLRTNHGRLERLTISKSRYEVRRTPVPRLSDFVSSPASAPRKLGDLVSGGALSGSLTLDTGGVRQPCRVDFGALPVPQEISIHNLTLKKMLGVGGQGRVYLAQSPTKKCEPMNGKEDSTQTMFAVKVMVKNRHASYDDILQEQRLLRRIRGNMFLLQLEASFHDRKNFYLITEYHSGGDLDSLLKLYGHFSVCAARIYIAELCAAVTFLHENFILHRDIKPSNILVKANGHICLGDLGLAVDFVDYATEVEDSFMAEAEPVVQGRAGTAMYMAPEVLNGEYYGFKADWWSVGVTCFNFFEGSHPWPCQELYWLTEHAGSECIPFQETNDVHIRSFIRALLRRDQDQRIGDKVIFSHTFFDEIDIQDIHRGQLTPPYLPQPVDAQFVPNTLRSKDRVEIGANYPEHATPMLDYCFYGPNFPDCSSSSHEDNHSFRRHESCRSFCCSQPMQEPLQTSCDKAGSGTINGGSLSAVVRPGRFDAISGPTVTKSFGLNNYPRNETPLSQGVKIIKKEPNFRWSMLSVEEGQFDDAPDSGIRVAVKARRVMKGFDNVQNSKSKIIIQQSCKQGRRGLKVGSVAVAPLKPFIPTLISPGCCKTFGRDSNSPAHFNGLASELNASIDPLMLSRTNTSNDSTQTTAPPSLLGLGLFVEGEHNLTGISSVVSLGLSSWNVPSEVFASDAICPNNFYATPFTLGNSAIGELVPSHSAATGWATSHAEDGSGDGVGFYDDSEPVVWDRFSSEMEDNTDKTLVSLSSPIEQCPIWNFQTLHGCALARIRVLLKRTALFTRLTSEWVKHFWSATCFN